MPLQAMKQHALEFAFSEQGLSRSESDCNPDRLPPEVTWICWRSERSGLAGAPGPLRSGSG